MERSIVAAIIGGLLGLSALSGLGLAVSSTGSGAAAPGGGKAEGDWRLLEPVTYENISIFPVVSSAEQDTAAFLTLDEGLAADEVLVTERGNEGMVRSRDGGVVIPDYERGTGASVNQLVLINRSKRPLLLLAGELVSGGKQDRIIGKDRIVPVGAPPLPLDVFCVEHGRWSSGSQFAASNTIVHPSVREQAAVNRDQQKVWDAVSSGNLAARGSASPSVPASAAPRISAEVVTGEISSNAPTASYEKIYERGRVGGSVDGLVDELERRFARATSGLKGERVIGVVVAYGGEVAWSDIFASSGLFGHYWHKLLRSYAVEALARPRWKEVASRDDAASFLQRLNGREVQESEPGVYRWRETMDGRLAEIELDALTPKPMTLHRLFLHRTV